MAKTLRKLFLPPEIPGILIYHLFLKYSMSSVHVLCSLVTIQSGTQVIKNNNDDVQTLNVEKEKIPEVAKGLSQVC